MRLSAETGLDHAKAEAVISRALLPFRPERVVVEGAFQTREVAFRVWSGSPVAGVCRMTDFRVDTFVAKLGRYDILGDALDHIWNLLVASLEPVEFWIMEREGVIP